MRWFRSMLGIGLCLGMAGCAATQQHVILGPGHTAAAHTAAAHSSCGCGAAKRPMLASANPAPAVATLASHPPMPPPLPSARFFPLLHEQDGAPADPLENPRADLLGVRTVERNKERGAPILRDTAMEKASTEGPAPTISEEPAPPTLPLVLKLAPGRDLPEVSGAPAEMVSTEFDSSSATQGLEPLQDGTPMPDEEPTPTGALGAEAATAPAPAPREHGETLSLEYADESLLAGRPRLSPDGSVRPGPRSNGEPARYGPDPTYPAAYYAGGSAPTSVPKNREVWPVLRPWRPTILPRAWQRIREAVAGVSGVPSASAVREARNVAERGQ